MPPKPIYPRRRPALRVVETAEAQQVLRQPPAADRAAIDLRLAAHRHERRRQRRILTAIAVLILAFVVCAFYGVAIVRGWL